MPKAKRKRIKLTIERFNRLNDRFVKYLLANPENKPLLIGLINDTLADLPEGAERIPPVADLVYRDRESAPTYKGDKLPRFDIVAVTEDGQVFLIEFQVAKDPNVLPRVLHYGARNVFMRTREGEKYASVRVIVIVIANFILFEDTEDYHTVHRILDVKTQAWRIKGLSFHFIELPKLRKRGGEPRTGLERLMYYFGDIGGEEMMNTLTQEDPRVGRMAQLEKLFRMDPDLLEDYLDQEQAHKDYEEAISSTREEEKFATARRFKAMGLSDEQIAQGVGLPLAEVEAL